MKQRSLGQNKLSVGAIGLGCWSFAGSYGPTDTVESHATLAKALDLGVDFLDTANVYGHGISEKAIGSFLKDNKHSFKIATKGGIKRLPGENYRTFDNSEEYLRGELEKSLTNLNVDYVDLYYVHRRESDRPIEEVSETLGKFVKEGKIGGIGYSEISPGSLRRAHAVHPVSAVQNEYSLWTRQAELGLVQACRELDVTFVPFSPVGRGIFSSTAPDPTTFGKADFRTNNPRFLEPNYSLNLKALQGFREFSLDKGLTMAQMALAWILHQDDYMIPIPGTRSVAHLSENAAAAEIVLSATDLQEIERWLPIGFAYGDRYSEAQTFGAERYC